MNTQEDVKELIDSLTAIEADQTGPADFARRLNREHKALMTMTIGELLMELDNYRHYQHDLYRSMHA